MAFFQLVLKARKLEKIRQAYEDEKLSSIEISDGAKARLTLKQRLRRRKLWFKKKVKKLFDKILAVPKASWYYKKIVAIRTDGTLENFIAKSFVGFVSGIFLTYIFFVFFVFQLNFKLSSATTLCTIIGIILTLGLAFSYRVRCIVFLLLPQFCSKRGRQALMAYAFILALTGPVKNTLHNTSVLSESLTCAQEQLKEAVKTIVDLAKQPFYALRDAISKVIRTVKVVVKKIKQTLIAIKRLVLSILRVITAVFQWLGSIINICNKKLGTPFDRCQSVFEGAVADCKAKLGPIFGIVCNITYVVSALCYIVKPLDFICMLVSYVADTVVSAVRSKVKKFTMHMKAMFYVKVKFSHSFHFETNQSKTIEEVSTGIVAEIRTRTDKLFGFFNWINFVASFFVFVILLRVMRYRYKWLTSERFDNRYITKDLRTIDLIRTRQEKETILPLNAREKNRYASLSSVMLIKTERVKLARSIVFLSLATVKLIAYMTIDYSLYWVLNTIRLYGRFQSKVERPNIVTIHVSGDGYLTELYRSIVKAFTPRGNDAEIDTMLCLPDPVRPDLDRYTQIVTLVLFCWLIAFFEPYGLRLRHVVMCRYYPDRAKQRAAWLYNHITRTRGSFLKFARRQLRRKFGLSEGEKIERVTLRERLWAVCPFLNFLFPLKQNACLLCGLVEREDNPHVKCPTPGCIGLFCTQCFADLQNFCTICRSPIEYGDLSDMSEERDSSDDQLPVIREKTTKPEAKEEKPDLVDEEEKVEEEEEEREEAEEEEEREDEYDTEEEDKIEEEEEEKVAKDVAEQTDDKYEEDLDRSSESYSYAYQDESPEEVELEKRREPFKDVEAQKIRDDVTVQIFNEPFVNETSSSSESPTSCFVVRARRKVRARSKRKPCSSAPRRRDSDSSTSIADTESWSTEEVDEEEVIHIEVGDSSEELLPRDRRDKEKRGRVNKIVRAVARIPWLGGKGNDDKTCKGLQRKRPSLMNRIVSMLHGKQSMPVQSYKRTRKIKDSSSSSSSLLSCDENEALLKLQDRETDSRHSIRRKMKRKREDEYDQRDNRNLRHPCQKGFVTKQLPRYLESVAESTSYFEVDETEDSRTSRKCVRQVEDINRLSSTKASRGSRKRDTWNITEEDELVASCSCTSEIAYEMTGDKEIYSLEMSTVSERTDDTEETVETGSENRTSVSQSDTDYIDETESSIKITRKRDDTKDDDKRYDKLDDLPAREGSGDPRGEKEKTKKLKEKTAEKSETKAAEEDVESSVVKKRSEQISMPVKEDTTRSTTREEIARDPPTIDSHSLYDPLAGLELYGVSYKTKRKIAPTSREIDIETEAEESESKDLEEKHIGGENTIEKLRKNDDTNEKSRKNDGKNEKSRKNDDTNEKSRKNDNTNEKSRKNDDTNEKSRKNDDTNEKSRKNDNRSERPMASLQTERVKIDKATDLPDKSRHTQTKLRERDTDTKSKRVERDTEALDAKSSRKLAEESNKGLEPKESNERLKFRRSTAVSRSKEPCREGKRRKKSSERKKRRKRCKRGASKRRKHSGSERSMLSDDEEFYSLQFEDRELPSKPRQKYSSDERYEYCYPVERSDRSVRGFRSTRCPEGLDDLSKRSIESKRELEKWESCEDAYSPYDSHALRTYQRYPVESCRCPRSYEAFVAHHIPRDTNVPSDVTRGNFIMPVVKKYLPMYQNLELIEELKRHDRMRLIREREASRREKASSPRSSASISLCSPRGTQRTDRIVIDTNKSIEEDERLPYQETQAYRNVLRELQKRSGETHEKSDSVPLMRLSDKADKSKKVKQLYPCRDRGRKRTDALKKFANKIIAPFKPVSCTKSNREIPAQDRKFKQTGTVCRDCSFDPEIMSDVSSSCICGEKARKSGTLTSTEETTDNNESTR